MSRVRDDQKYVNISRKEGFCTGPSKIIRSKGPNPNWHNAKTLTSWLFLKYDMSYEQFQGKSKDKRDQLRKEYKIDTPKDSI